MEAYGAAKARLFDVPDLQHRVINVGDAFGHALAMRPGAAANLIAVWVGARESGRLAGRWLEGDEVVPGPHGMSLTVSGSFGCRRVATRLFGRFNAENAVVVIALLIGLGVPLEDAAAALAECVAPPGRMQVIESDGPGKPMAVIDYAHTPDALAKALQAVKEHAQGAVWCVFGCGGDRDPGKRPLMGAAADEYADQIIVTDDNPRSEDPESICRTIVRGIRSRGVRIIHDRGDAIATALNEAAPADIVLIAGKGHEEYQIYGDVRRRFSDRHEAVRHLRAVASPERP
jgi:UDP-N-acetylmuramoyl-L-alanyl-D-glutamate--2,6-diaminopimelate ligase